MITAATIWFIGYGIAEGLTGGDAGLFSWPVSLGEWVRKRIGE